MAPGKKTKQTLIPLAEFVKKPSKKLARKHQRLVKKAEKKQDAPQKKGMSGWLKKQIREREKERKETEKRCEEWREWIRVKGISHLENANPLHLYQVHGPAPPLEAPNGDLFYDGELDTTIEEGEEDAMVTEEDEVTLNCGEDDDCSHRNSIFRLAATATSFSSSSCLAPSASNFDVEAALMLSCLYLITCKTGPKTSSFKEASESIS